MDDWVDEAEAQARRLWFLGYGPNQSRDKTELSSKLCKQIAERMAQQFPSFLLWRDKVRAQSRHDGFLQNSYGRRAYSLKDGECERFLLQSEVTDNLLAEAVRRRPYALCSDGFLEEE